MRRSRSRSRVQSSCGRRSSHSATSREARRFGPTVRVLCAWADWFPTADPPPTKLGQKTFKQPVWEEVAVQQCSSKKAMRLMGLMVKPQLWYQVKFAWADVHWVPDEYPKPLPEPKEAEKKKEDEKKGKSTERRMEKPEEKRRSRG